MNFLRFSTAVLMYGTQCLHRTYAWNTRWHVDVYFCHKETLPAVVHIQRAYILIKHVTGECLPNGIRDRFRNNTVAETSWAQRSRLPHVGFIHKSIFQVFHQIIVYIKRTMARFTYLFQCINKIFGQYSLYVCDSIIMGK